ncbi:hypothetical protein [Dyadobacter fermentans]|uniref:Uncharacterized protein n=1 Tax=Dyadobacter fermentans (strain ATCC 700827 / DSM 18053 / CIP 107007 / KCTC 52180 / NS114) TaxID=471854 RepID=C6W0W8_DYAFD|nr:hypothetical protein [Dyadobacter fermentans]ACT95423.1 hypothetical protein Dfer_4220 [Dyadobacter fermentans DSM 18053]
MRIYQEIWNSVLAVLESIFSSDTDVVSSEAKEIMANPKDREIYVDAVEKLKPGKSDTITLSTGPMTISSR